MENKQKKGKTEDYEIRFWKDWLNADSLRRFEMIEKMPAFDMCQNLFKTFLKMRNKKNKKMLRYSFATLLNGYFGDLVSAVYTKIKKPTGF